MLTAGNKKYQYSKELNDLEWNILVLVLSHLVIIEDISLSGAYLDHFYVTICSTFIMHEPLEFAKRSFTPEIV